VLKLGLVVPGDESVYSFVQPGLLFRLLLLAVENDARDRPLLLERAGSAQLGLLLPHAKALEGLDLARDLVGDGHVAELRLLHILVVLLDVALINPRDYFLHVSTAVHFSSAEVDRRVEPRVDHIIPPGPFFKLLLTFAKVLG
jgi:hypothetical protein